jgi:hypothetical protein
MLDQQFGAPNFGAAYNSVLNPPVEGGPALGHGDAAMTLQQRTVRHVGGPLTNGQASHFVNDWLGTWWPNHAVPDTLRLGMLEAIKCAQAAKNGIGLPMEFFWVCLQDNVFQIYYSEGAQQVTVLILTPPPPPGYDAGPLAGKESLWVVKRWDVFDDNYPTVNGTPAGRVAAPQNLGFTTSPPPGTIIKQQIWHS